MSEEEKAPESEAKKPKVTQKLDAAAKAGAENAAKPRPRRRETKVLEAEAESSPEAKVLEAEVESPPEAKVPVAHLGLTREETNWAAVAHASILLTLLLGVSTGGIAAFFGPIVPAIIWFAYRDKSEYVMQQARQATIFQVAGLLGLLALALVGAIVIAIGWAVSAVLVIVLIGVLLLVVMLLVTLLWAGAVIALPIAQVIYGCYAAVEAYNGRPFRYWWIADAVDRYEAQA